MKLYNEKIQSHQILYDLDQVNCFERDFCLSLFTISECLPKLFLILNNFDRCYSDERRWDSIFNRELFVINNLLGVDATKQYGDDLSKLIKKNMLSKKIVLIPVNLFEVYYANQYKETDWPHLLLVKGINEKKELVFIMDGTHLHSNEPTEREFALTYEMLNDATKAFFPIFEKKALQYVLCISNKSNNKNSLMSEKKCFDYIFDDNNYRANYQIDELRGVSQKDCKDIARYLFNMPKRRELFFSLLLKVFKERNMIDQIEYRKLNKEKDNLVCVLKDVIRKYYKNVLSDNKKIDYPEFEEVKIYEREIRTYLKNIYLRKSKKIYNNLKSGSDCQDVQVINPGIEILTQNKKKYAFKFSGRQTFNTWVEDESPKVLFESSNNINFEVDVNVTNNTNNASFVAGIVIRDASTIYYFGIDSGKRINLDKSGLSASIASYVGDINSAKLKIIFHDNVCIFSIQVGEKKYITLKKVHFDNSTIEYGVGCKTFYQAKELEVEFEIEKNKVKKGE